LIEQLREQIRQDGRSLNQLGKESGVDAARLSRFMTGKRGLRIEALDELFKVLRLRVVREEQPPAPERPRRRRAGREGEAPPRAN
jgi:hypothetical protein